MMARIRMNERRIRMTPEADRVHARLLRYTVEDHRADRGWLAMTAAKLILEQALAAKAEQSQRAPNGGVGRRRQQARYVDQGLRRLALQV
jgi:hypothetical protein